MDDEMWLPVPSKPGYMASSWGRIKLPEKVSRLPKGGSCIRKTAPRYGDIARAKKGASHVYYTIKTREHGHLKVHRLVCEAFHGPPPVDQNICLHLNENALDNRPENLRWGTQKENLNMPRFIEYCRARTGDDSPTVKGRMVRQKAQNTQS